MSEATLTAPGLYLRSLEAEAPEAAQTALCAFIGVTLRGPLDSPQIVHGFGEFVTVFGDVAAYGRVGESVYAFFMNGGEAACVVRVARPAPIVVVGSGSCTSKQDVATAAAVTPVRDANGNETLRLVARNPGTWGNALNVTLFAEAGREMALATLTASVASGATVVTVDEVHDFRVGGGLRLIHRSNVFIKGACQIVAIDESTRQLHVSPPVAHAYPQGSSVAGLGFGLEVDDGSRRELFEGLSINPTHPRYVVSVVNGSAGAPYLDLARAGSSLLVAASPVLDSTGQPRFKPVDAAGITFAGGGDGLTFATGKLLDGSAADSVLATARVGGRAGSGIRIAAEPFAGRLALAVPSEPGAVRNRVVLDDVQGWVIGDTFTLTSASNPAVSESASVASVDLDGHGLGLAADLTNSYPLGSTCTVAGRFNLHVTSGALEESFDNLAMAAGPRFFADVVNGPAGSLLVCVSPGSGTPGLPVGSATLTGGSDPDEIPLPNYTGYAGDGSLFLPSGGSGAVGLASLEAVPSVALVAVPDVVGRTDLSDDDVASAQTQVLYHCQKMGERFALLDVPAGLEPADCLDWAGRFADPTLARFGALYYPWITVAVEGADRSMPPTGAVAGLFATSDRQGGVGRAPANLSCKGVVGLERDLDADDQGALNLAGVNCIRKFEVGALRLWGARTLSRDDQYLYVHNRRIVLLTIKTLSSGLRWAVFEPNDATLRRRVKNSIEGFLRGMLARGLGSGGRPEDTYYVKVDDELNPPASVDAGNLIAEIGLAPSKPAEFIVITVKRSPDILTLVEAEA